MLGWIAFSALWCLLMHMWTTPVCGQNLCITFILSSKKWGSLVPLTPVCDPPGHDFNTPSLPYMIRTVIAVTNLKTKWCRNDNTNNSLRGLLLSMLTYYIWNEKEDVLIRHVVHVIEGIGARVWANGRFSRLDIRTCIYYLFWGENQGYTGERNTGL